MAKKLHSIALVLVFKSIYLLFPTSLYGQACDDPCELIGNSNFKSLNANIYTDLLAPFNYNAISCWRSSHGSAHIPELVPLPGSCPSISNPDDCFEDYIYMWHSTIDYNGEGILQDQSIIANKKYFYTFDYRFTTRYAVNATDIDHIYVKFITYGGSFLSGASASGAAIPTPTTELTLSHLQDKSNLTFATQCGAIQPTENYSALWIYPRHETAAQKSAIEVTNIHLYNVDAGPDQVICSYTPTTLGACPTTPVPGMTYSWSPATGLSSTTVAHPTCTLTNPSATDMDVVYTLTTTFCGNTITDDCKVTVKGNPFANATITGYPNRCIGESANYGVSGIFGSYTYNWSFQSGSGSIVSPAAATTNISFTSPGINVLKLVLFDPITGCSRTIYYTVTVATPPPAPIITSLPDYACMGNFTYTIDNFNPLYNYTFTSITGGTVVSPVNATGNFTINWTTAGGNFTLSANQPPYTCNTSANFTIAACCSDPLQWVNVYPDHYDNTFDMYVDFLYPLPATVSNKLITVNGTLHVDLSMTFNNCTFKMGENAKISVDPGETLTLNNCILTICNQPWDGIYLPTSTSNLVMNNTFTEHAKNAVVSINGGKYTIKNSKFKDNAIGIDVNTLSTVQHPGTVSGTEFYTAAPIITGVPFVGIRMQQQYNLLIGDPNAILPANNFHDLNYGITGSASNYGIFSNDFHDIPGTCPYISSTNSGVFTLGYNNNLPASSDFIKVSKCNFNVCENGILHSFIYRATIANNNFNRIPEYGYYCYDPANVAEFSQLLVIENDMTDVKNGVAVIETALLPFSAQVSNNAIMNTDRGIYFTNLRSPLANLNCIILNDPINSSVWNIGIYNQGCVSANAFSNSVRGSNLGTTTAGIRSDVSPANLFKDNVIDGCFLSLTTVGDCPSTQFKCNNLYNYLGAGYYQLSGKIGPQGSSAQSFYNKWYTNTNNKLVDAYSDGTLSRFYVRNSGVYNVNITQSQSLTPNPPIPVTQAPYPGPDGCLTNAPVFPCAKHTLKSSLSITPSDTERVEKTLDLYRWNVNPAIPKTPNEDYMQKDILYKMYLQNPSDFTGVDVSDFLNSLSKFQIQHVNNNSAKWQNLSHSKLSAMDPSNVLASSAETLTPNNGMANDSIVVYYSEIAELQDQLNQLILTTYQRQEPYLFTELEVDQLTSIAKRCPIQYGGVVYQARAILEPITHQMYVNECEQPSGFRLYETTFEEVNKTDIIRVYPNPTENETLNVDIDAKLHPEATITIYNMLGQLMNSSKLIYSENVVSIEALTPGNYLFKIVDADGNELYQGKLVKLE